MTSLLISISEVTCVRFANSFDSFKLFKSIQKKHTHPDNKYIYCIWNLMWNILFQNSPKKTTFLGKKNSFWRTRIVKCEFFQDFWKNADARGEDIEDTDHRKERICPIKSKNWLSKVSSRIHRTNVVVVDDDELCGISTEKNSISRLLKRHNLKKRQQLLPKKTVFCLFKKKRWWPINIFIYISCICSY